MFIPYNTKETNILDRMSGVSRYDCFVHPKKTGTKEDVSISPVYIWIMISFVLIPWIDMSLIINIISTAESILFLLNHMNGVEVFLHSILKLGFPTYLQ